MSAGSPHSVSTKGLFSTFSPLDSREVHDHHPMTKHQAEANKGSLTDTQKSRNVITLFSDLAYAEEKSEEMSRIKTRKKKDKEVSAHISEVTGKKKVVTKDTTVQSAFSVNIPTTSPHKKLSIADKQRFESGWNGSHSSSHEKSHNKILKKKVQVEISKKMYTSTPEKLRHRLLHDGGIYTHGMFADSSKPNIADRLGLPELEPPKFVHAAEHGPEAA